LEARTLSESGAGDCVVATRGWQDVTAADVARMGRKAVASPVVRRSKFGAVKTVVDGITFASKAEAGRYSYLKALERTGHITNLELQPVYPLIVAGITIGKYLADFRYYRHDGEMIVEDVKGMRTPVYRLKRRIVEAYYCFQITEIK
jgi:hypothetical protein